MPYSNTEKQRRHYAKLRSIGRCVDCKNAALLGQCRCAFHAEEKRKESRRNKRWLKESERSKQRQKWRELKIAVFQAYGSKCACCGETETCFLSLDHVNNDGYKHRRELSPTGRYSGMTHSVYLWVRRNQFPSTLRLLCFNCNMGRKINGGICPHVKAEK